MSGTALQRTELVVRTVADTALENEKYFGDLDAVVGDGDFGYSLARGFEKLLDGWDDLDRSDVGAFLKRTGMVLASRIGGTSGPIWGTAFMRAGIAAGPAQELSGEQVVAMLRAAAEGIKARGQSDVGDKTLLDALVPFIDRLERELTAGATGDAALRAAAAAAREAADATTGMLARRGRAAYTGERSRGSVDAGAMAVAVFTDRIQRGLAETRSGVMKKFVNDPKRFVPEMLEGLALANPDTLRYVPEYNLIMRADAPREDRVSIVQGSGSGHEPAHVMVVGRGMLDAACPGDVFAAPPMDYVYETTKLLASPKGVLLLVNNYTGDRMAFDMGREMAEADGIRAEILTVNDDVAVKDSLYTVGRRGVAGNFFVIKAVGAAADRGAELDEVARIGRKVNDVTRSIGVALTACTPPAKGSPLFDLGADEIEFGVGIHGEPGRERRKIADADAIMDDMLDAVVPDLPYESGDRVALMINGLGGTPISELYILYRRAHQRLAERGVTVGRSYVNEYCTSLDMAGASLTLVRLDEEIEDLLGAPAETPVRVF